MLDELKALAKLAKMDTAAKEFDEELRSLPQRIDEMRADVQTLETLLAAERAQIDEAKSLKEARATELSERNDALSKAKAKAGRSRTLREVDAAEREVEANRKAITDLRQDIEKLQATIDAKTASLGEREAQFEEARKLFQEEEAEATARLKEVREKLGAVTAGRDDIMAALPKRIAKRYERLRARTASKYMAVAILDSRNCISCQMALPPQLYIELQRGEDFHSCPVCNALLVHARVLGDAPAAPEE
ncbi:MAG: C4-type zinc ribbon domain-containing protein [Myxococcota bacterium]